MGCNRHCKLSPLFVDMEYEIIRTVLKTAIPIEDGTEGYGVLGATFVSVWQCSYLQLSLYPAPLKLEIRFRGTLMHWVTIPFSTEFTES